MKTEIKTLESLLGPGETRPAPEWQLKVVQSEQCLSYVAWNKRTQEALVIDPKEEDIEAFREIHRELKGYLWLGVIDSHTHADHVSITAQLADELGAPPIMHALAPSQRVQIRVSKNTSLPSQAAPLQLISTPGTPKIRSPRSGDPFSSAVIPYSLAIRAEMIFLAVTPQTTMRAFRS